MDEQIELAKRMAENNHDLLVYIPAFKKILDKTNTIDEFVINVSKFIKECGLDINTIFYSGNEKAGMTLLDATYVYFTKTEESRRRLILDVIDVMKQISAKTFIELRGTPSTIDQPRLDQLLSGGKRAKKNRSTRRKRTRRNR